MPKIVAIRKSSDLPESLMQEAESVEEKRQLIVDTSRNFSRRADELVRDGFEYIPAPEDKAVFIPLPEDKRSFSRLRYIGAYVINVPDKDKGSKQAAEEILKDKYIILPNVRLNLPHSPTGLEAGKPINQIDDVTDWPDISGISLARQAKITGSGVYVGVLDTGCVADHSEFQGKNIEFIYVDPGDPGRSRGGVRAFDIDPQGHGTHVCGIICGKTLGIAPDVDLMVASVIDNQTVTTSLQRILFALNWMLATLIQPHNQGKPAIINFSLGIDPKDIKGRNARRLTQALKLMLNRMVDSFSALPIVAIGNDGPGRVRMPGYFKETLSVGAIDFDLQPADFSGGGKAPDHGEMQPDIVGFGVNVYSAMQRDTSGNSLFARKNGTSMATPYVTGIASLYASTGDRLQGMKLREKLLQTTHPLASPADRVGSGLARYTKDQ